MPKRPLKRTPEGRANITAAAYRTLEKEGIIKRTNRLNEARSARRIERGELPLKPNHDTPRSEPACNVTDESTVTRTA